MGGSNWFETLAVNQHMIGGREENEASRAHKCRDYPRLKLFRRKDSKIFQDVYSWCTFRIYQQRKVYCSDGKEVADFYCYYHEVLKDVCGQYFWYSSLLISLYFVFSWLAHSFSYRYISPSVSQFPLCFYKQSKENLFFFSPFFFFFSVQCLTHPLYQSPNTWLLLVWLDSFFETSNMHNDRIYASFSVLILVKIFCKLGLGSLYYKTWSVGDPIIRRKWTKSVHFRYSKNFCFKYQTWHVSLRFPLSSFWRCTISNF